MSYGKLVKMIIKTKVSDYLNWKPVDGIYVYQWQKGGFFSKEGGKIEKVPATPKEAASSDLMSLLEKGRCYQFMNWLLEFDLKKPETYKKKELDPRNVTFTQWIKYWNLDDNTVDFLGHAVALYTTDEFLNRPALEVIEKMQLYYESNGRFGNSPFIYPVYGLAGIPESFARKSAVMGGTFMLNVTTKGLTYDPQTNLSTFTGVFDGEEGTAKAKIVIANPAYYQLLGHSKLIKPISKTIRCICILDHPIPHTGNSNAVQIIIPQKQTGRKSDVYIVALGASHGVCKKGYFLAILSTTAEAKTVDEDLKVAYDIVGPIAHKFVTEEVVYQTASNEISNNWFVTSTLDATSHFESAAENVQDIYRKITKKELDLNIEKEMKEQA